MADVTINYEGSTIATMSASGTKTLLTQGKYCTDDIEVVYASPGGGGGGVSGTFTPVSDTRSVTLSDCIGKTSIVVFPMFDLTPEEITNRVHWGLVHTNGRTIFQASTNTAKTAFVSNTIMSNGTGQVGTPDTWDSTTGVLTIVQAAGNNYGGYFASGKQYGYIAW